MSGGGVGQLADQASIKFDIFRLLPAIGASLAVVIGVVGLMGWAFRIEILATGVQRAVAVNPLTAVCLILCGAGIALSMRSRKLSSLALGLAITAIATGKCIDLMTGRFNIDRILFADRLNKVAGLLPNRMAPNTAIVLLLAGVSLTLAQSDRSNSRSASQVIAIWVLLAASLVLIGYVLNVTQFGGLSPYISMSLPTALGMSFVATGLLSLSPETGLVMVLRDRGSVGSICRKALLPVATVPVLAGVLRIFGERFGAFNEQAGVTLQIMSNVIFSSTIFIICMVALCRGDRALRLREAALKHSEQFNRLIASANPDCITLLDSDGVILFCNTALLQIYGLKNPSELVGRQWGEKLDQQSQDERHAALATAREQGTGRLTVRHPGANGEARWFDTLVSRLSPEDDSPFHFLVTWRDITERKSIQDRVNWEATHDGLTQLPNRAHFQAHLDRQIESLGDKGFALLLLDVDDFKLVNDTLGHDAGDSLLCVIAQRIRGAIRGGDFVGRLAGDEFAIVLQGEKTEGGAIAAAERIVERLTEPWIYGSRLIDCRASIGASIAPRHGETAQELLKNADIALYAAKRNGKGRLAVFQSSMRSSILKRSREILLAREAIREGLIVPHYQPKIELSTGGIAGFEALLRWKHPTRGMQLPATIAAAFEDIELAGAVTNCMLKNIVCDMARWLEQGLDFGHIAVNLSAADLKQREFADRLLARLDARSIPHSCLQVEITETVFLGRGSEHVERGLRILHAKGIRIALDDFGTGYASLSHLKQFPVDIVKIDKSFLSNFDSSPHSDAIVTTVISLGRSLNIEVVAEGIETEEQEKYLIAKGCALGQGYYYGRAVPAARLPKLVGFKLPASGNAA